ncbi:hypothetical protein PpBr36_02302, partial [Pyricularia pennisetigena]|uniref:hypothetical protein n=1 Tax=Pyricularia pennisetigena TaxID=1578925 RepID=UPI00114E309B
LINAAIFEKIAKFAHFYYFTHKLFFHNHRKNALFVGVNKFDRRIYNNNALRRKTAEQMPINNRFPEPKIKTTNVGRPMVNYKYIYKRVRN